MPSSIPFQAGLPSVDALLRHPAVTALTQPYGRQAVVAALREELSAERKLLALRGNSGAQVDDDEYARRTAARLKTATTGTLRPVFNLSGVVIHSNLGRAELPEEAIQALLTAARSPVNLEFDLMTGKRGDRDHHLEPLLTRLAGAEKATVVNNNAAAVLLVLHSLANKREVLVSRGELIEIGGEFRMPDIMKSAGCKLVEVGTTNRTHLRDYADALGPRTALILKVHPSNFEMRGFIQSVDESELAGLAHRHGVPVVSDLGSGSLVDFGRFHLPNEQTPSRKLQAGCDLVTFSCDKALGGPQAGIIAGRRDLIERINRHPLKRVMRLDKLRVAALEAVLRLYTDPDRLHQRLPVLRHMTRSAGQIEAQALRLLPKLQAALGQLAMIRVVPCESEVGSGALPLDRLPSHALAVAPTGAQRRASGQVDTLSRNFRALPIPVIGRIKDKALYFDLRCLDDEAAFVDQLNNLFDEPGDAGAS
ncbi:MAG: L-seryl-tRNA(Sec) selenium transferase [Variovorax sp.]